jgi:hypothetical protein
MKKSNSKLIVIVLVIIIILLVIFIFYLVSNQSAGNITTTKNSTGTTTVSGPGTSNSMSTSGLTTQNSVSVQNNTTATLSTNPATSAMTSASATTLPPTIASESVATVPVNMIATENATINGKKAAYNNPIIPKGFKAINDGTTWPADWNAGLTIEDASGNQFVWVPVDGTNVPYQKWDGEVKVTQVQSNSTIDDTLPVGINETSQISQYGGFYIARYEAGKEKATTLVSKKGSLVWVSISYPDAKAKAEAMFNTESVKSSLITGRQWDSTMRWIKNMNTVSVTDSSAWGNYNSTIKTTGFNESWKAKNIYDLAGNAFEWTSEKTDTFSISRGGYYYVTGNVYPAVFRIKYSPASVSEIVSFRVALFVI